MISMDDLLNQLPDDLHIELEAELIRRRNAMIDNGMKEFGAAMCIREFAEGALFLFKLIK